MRKVLASAAFLLFAATPVLAADVHSFSRGGERYEYVASRDAAGTITLDGRSVTSDTPFMLTVRDRRVTGRMGVEPVDFRVSNETRAHLDAEIATPVVTASAL